MDRFAHEHPWMTLMLALAAINGVVIVVRGYNPAWAADTAALKAASTKLSTADKVAGLFGIPGGSPIAPSASVGALFGSGFPAAAPVNRAVWGRI